MKAKVFYLVSLEALSNAVAFITKTIPDGSIKVTVSDAGSKSGKQRGLQWMGYDDVVLSGIGDKYCDTKENVHLVAKYRFAIPIFVRDDSLFADLYMMWCNKYENSEDKEKRMLYFVDQCVSTEKFNISQMAEFLTEFRNDCLSKGISLREPEFQGLLDGNKKEEQ